MVSKKFCNLHDWCSGADVRRKFSELKEAMDVLVRENEELVSNVEVRNEELADEIRDELREEYDEKLMVLQKDLLRKERRVEELEMELKRVQNDYDAYVSKVEESHKLLRHVLGATVVNGAYIENQNVMEV